jgi:Zn-dependent M28 family amino/carboxypeptidase
VRWRRVALALAALLVALLGGAYWYMIRCEGRWSGPRLEARMRGQLPGLEAKLRSDAAFLADSIGPRNTAHPEALERAEAWVRGRWEAQGYRVEAQPLEVGGVWTDNLGVEIPGRRLPSQIVLVSAQYDSWPDSPGANNNASGMAVLLQLSRMLRDVPLDRTLRLVAFTLQEPPYEQMGSGAYAYRSRQRGERIRVMLSMDAIGIYKHEPGSQKLPYPFSLLYPDRGDFLAFIGDLSSRSRVVDATRGFEKGTAFPVEAGSVPRWVEGASWSDHESFWHEGYRAIQITDTGAFRSATHTTSADTLGLIDFTSLARVTLGMYGAVRELTSVEGYAP